MRAPECRFADTRARLDAHFARNPDQLSTDVYWGYLVTSKLDAAIQCILAGGAHDSFEALVTLLRGGPELRERYNNLKRAWDGRPMVLYRQAKAAFIAAALWRAN